MKRKNPQTSLDAYKSLKNKELTETYKIILHALSVLGKASSEEISEFTGVKHDRLWKRFSDLHKIGVIYRPGEKVINKSGRSAYRWALVTNNEKDNIEKPIKGKSISEITKEMAGTIQSAKSLAQGVLF